MGAAQLSTDLPGFEGLLRATAAEVDALLDRLVPSDGGGLVRTVLLVPRRAQPERDKLWAYARTRWERYHPELEIVERTSGRWFGSVG